MPRAPLTREQLQTFRRRAIDAATRLFAEQGYEAVSMRSIAGELGCSPMTPYRYFADKDELFAHVRADAFRRFADEQAAAASRHRDPIARIRAIGRAYVDFALGEPDAYRVMFELAQPTDRRYRELEAEGLRAFSYLRAAVEDAVAARKLRGDPLTVAHLLWAKVHGLVSLHMAGKLLMGRNLKDLLDTALELEDPR